MSDYYLDSSALAKRYLPEVGTAWVRGLVAPSAGHTIWVAEIAEAEVASALEGVRYRGLPLVGLSTAIQGGNGERHNPPATVARYRAAQARWQVRLTRQRPASAYRAHSREQQVPNTL